MTRVALDASLPPKVISQHRWILMTTFAVTHEVAESLYNLGFELNEGEKQAGPELGDEIRDMMLSGEHPIVALHGLGCVDCGLPFISCHKRPCAAKGIETRGKK